MAGQSGEVSVHLHLCLFLLLILDLFASTDSTRLCPFNQPKRDKNRDIFIIIIISSSGDLKLRSYTVAALKKSFQKPYFAHLVI